MTSPRTSFIVPARNAAPTLEQTLDSLLAQTDTDWEALITDDGSSDDTARIGAGYAGRDARFVFIAGGDGDGASATRNRGLEQARGQRVVFLDSDDWLDASFLARMHAALDATPGAVAAYCDYCRVMPDGRHAPAQGEPGVALDPVGTFVRHCAVAIHAVLVERETVLRAGNFDPSLRTCEDWDLWLRVALQGGPWVYVAEAMAFYRQRSNSLSCDMGQFVVDGMVVIRRGQDAVARLPAANGTSRNPEADAAYFALWCCAFEAGRGRMLEPMPRDLLRALSPDGDHVQAQVATLVYGLEVGQQAVPKELAARWPRYGHAAVQLIGVLGELWGDAVAARRLQYALERQLLLQDDLAAPRPLALTLGLRVDLRRAEAVTPPAGVDRLHAALCDGDERLGTIEIGVLGRIDTADWLVLARDALGLRRLLSAARAPLLRTLTPRSAGSAVRAVARPLWQTAKTNGDWRGGVKHAARQALQRIVVPSRREGSHHAELERLRDEARRTAPAPAPATPALPADGAPRASATVEPDAALEPGGASRQAYWEQYFRAPDPWNYGSAYEREKYALQLSLLPQRPIGKALELACAEGHFTLMLAPRVQHLVATDISATAVERARERCRDCGNVAHRQLDFTADALPAGQDLIVCSEVLYYLPDEATVRSVGQRLADALAGDGLLITAHAYVLNDDLSSTGFDWDQPWGAKTIARALSGVPSLALQRSVRTPLYQIDLYARRLPGTAAPAPQVELQPVRADIEHEVARWIVWGGAATRRADVAAHERHARIPVLMYHRIADDGPRSLAPYRVGVDAFAAQMAWLRRHGYHAIVADELAWFFEQGHPFVGRPVMISFDDAYQDFADAAWPLLRRHDFRADVFVVTDLVGGCAEWDRPLGAPAPLMDAKTIAALAAQGVRFGSHLATHRDANGLSTRETAQELLRSRHALAQWTGHLPCAMAAPYGATDQRLRALAAQCGYRLGFSTESGAATLAHDALHLPRLEVHGDMALEEFAALLEAAR